jgi:hypothetical protein
VRLLVLLQVMLVEQVEQVEQVALLEPKPALEQVLELLR